MNADKTEKNGVVALLSGGLDSTVSLAVAAGSGRSSIALFFDYLQNPREKEESAARAIASHYGAGFRKIEMHWLGRLSGSALVSGEVPDHDAKDASKAVWVENRNGIFVNAAAAVAGVNGCGSIIAGFNREEAETFPDNSKPWIDAVNTALAIGAGSAVKIESPTIDMDKKRIAAEGLRLDIPWELLWSCYRSGPSMCGRCESCSRLRSAISGTEAEDRVRFEG